MANRRKQTQYNFAQIASTNVRRSVMDRSHGHKTTFDSGYIVPIFVDEALPGDTFRMNATLFGRLATPIVPIMDNIHLDVHFFAVPYRLLWDNWQRFCGEQDNPGDSIDFTIPVTIGSGTGYVSNTLQDYMGLPIGVGNVEHSCLPMRAYNMIYNEWYRAEHLQDSVFFNTGNGPDSRTNHVLLRRGKRHDYFTSANPWPQKGDDVLFPLGGTAPVALDAGQNMPAFGVEGQPPSFNIPEHGTPLNMGKYVQGSQSDQVQFSQEIDLNDTGDAEWDNPQLWTAMDGVTGVTDLSAATAISVNQFREGVAVQHILERDARGGTRYTEILRSHFGVISPDQRLQRPEFLGGGTTRVNMQPVPQTSQSDTETPQANLAAFGTFSSGSMGFTKSFVEHSVVLGLVTARADLNYQQGLNRMWSRKTRYDFYWPDLANLGEQAILNKEIYMQDLDVIDPETEEPINDSVFGYQERWSEYRYKPSQITGQFRSTASTPLDIWHLAQNFDELPTLSPDFIVEDPPIDRVIAVQNEAQFKLDCHFDLRCVRPMPMYSRPGLTRL